MFKSISTILFFSTLCPLSALTEDEVTEIHNVFIDQIYAQEDPNEKRLNRESNDFIPQYARIYAVSMAAHKAFLDAGKPVDYIEVAEKEFEEVKKVAQEASTPAMKKLWQAYIELYPPLFAEMKKAGISDMSASHEFHDRFYTTFESKYPDILFLDLLQIFHYSINDGNFGEEDYQFLLEISDRTARGETIDDKSLSRSYAIILKRLEKMKIPAPMEEEDATDASPKLLSAKEKELLNLIFPHYFDFYEELAIKTIELMKTKPDDQQAVMALMAEIKKSYFNDDSTPPEWRAYWKERQEALAQLALIESDEEFDAAVMERMGQLDEKHPLASKLAECFYLYCSILTEELGEDVPNDDLGHKQMQARLSPIFKERWAQEMKK